MSEEENRYRIIYEEGDKNRGKVKRPGDYYEEVGDAIQEGVSYYKYAKEVDPTVKVDLTIETDKQDGKKSE